MSWKRLESPGIPWVMVCDCCGVTTTPVRTRPTVATEDGGIAWALPEGWFHFEGVSMAAASIGGRQVCSAACDAGLRLGHPSPLSDGPPWNYGGLYKPKRNGQP